MKKILIPTDFSEGSFSAMDFGAYLARLNNSELFLLHVLTAPGLIPDFREKFDMVADGTLMMQMLDESKTKLDYLKSSQLFYDLKVNVKLKPAEPIYSGIKDYAQQINADLIIMGTHGESGPTNLSIGSNTGRVSKISPIPVLTIPYHFDKNKIKKIVFVTDFSGDDALIFPRIQKFAEILTAELNLVKIVTPYQFDNTKKIINDVTAFFNKLTYQFPNFIYNDYSFEDGVLHCCLEIKGDLIALGIHRLQGQTDLFYPYHLEKTILNSPIPLLTINKVSL